MVKQPSCVHGRSGTFVAHWLTMKDAPPIGWELRCCFLYMSHSGHDEEDCIATLEAVRNNMNEGRKLGAVDFYIGGGINIELKLEDTGENIRGLDGIDWYGS